MKEYYIINNGKTTVIEAKDNEDLWRKVISLNIEYTDIFSADDGKFLDISKKGTNDKEVIVGDIIQTSTGRQEVDGLPFIVGMLGSNNIIGICIIPIYLQEDLEDLKDLRTVDIAQSMISGTIIKFENIGSKIGNTGAFLADNIKEVLPQFIKESILNNYKNF